MFALHSARALALLGVADVMAVSAIRHRFQQAEGDTRRKWAMSDPEAAIGVLRADHHEVATVRAIRSNSAGGGYDH